MTTEAYAKVRDDSNIAPRMSTVRVRIELWMLSYARLYFQISSEAYSPCLFQVIDVSKATRTRYSGTNWIIARVINTAG